LFAGIGGIELGFREALGGKVETALLCENWEPAKRVLKSRFTDVDIHSDVRTLHDLPSRLDVLAAGFPCTDLSQAGRTGGISGRESGLVSHVFDLLQFIRRRRRKLPWLLIENVQNMLALDRGGAMAFLTRALGELGYRWAYRLVDSRFTGLPQRRRRVILLASRTEDPRAALFADDAAPLVESSLRTDAFGFYWTEGRGGLGWAQDGTPTLKGGSTLGIPSPPAVWLPRRVNGPRFVVPSVEGGEALQGFPRGWTRAATEDARRNGPRWKLVGNAVPVDVARWVAERIAAPGTFEAESAPWTRSGPWPAAAWGDGQKVWRVAVSEFPRLRPYQHLLDVLDLDSCPALSSRAVNGFWGRLQQGNLGRYPGFREDVEAHTAHRGQSSLPIAV
jgi:DNA (cytosine-5)-methyltransferase 1